MKRGWRANAAATGIFLFALLCLFHGLLQFDPQRYVMAEIAEVAQSRWDRLAIFDLNFSIAMTARNAYTLVEKPWDLFQLEQCHPQDQALALGEPMVAHGLLGIPGYLAAGDPVLTFNSVVLLATLIGALAMYALVVEWTDEPAAGIAAGLLYGFHATKIGDVMHFFVWDLAWTALVLLFLKRLFEEPRWRDAVALAAAGSVQIVGSIYPMVSGVVLGSVVFAWLVARHGWRSVPWRHLAFVVVVGGGVALAMYAPYLALREEGTIAGNPFYAYLAFAWMAPGGRFDLGWALPLLGLAGVVLARARGAVSDAGVCFAIAAGGVALLWIATGGTTGDQLEALANDRPTSLPQLFNPWPPLLVVIPALEIVRAPAALLSGFHFALCWLAGFGMAALLRMAPPRSAPWLAAALVAIAFVDTIRPAFLGMSPRIQYAAIDVAPRPDLLQALGHLREIGNDGPLFEVWLDRPQNLSDKERNSTGALLTAYHHRRSSTCYNSFLQADAAELDRLEVRVQERETIERLAEFGFTTILVHHDRLFAVAQRRLDALDAMSVGEGAMLEKLYVGERVSAYEIRASHGPAPVRS